MQAFSIEIEKRVEIAGALWCLCANKRWVVASQDSSLLLLDMESLEKVKKIKTEQEEAPCIRRAEFDAERENVLGVCYFNGACEIVDIAEEKLVQRLEGAESEVKSVSFDRAGRLAFSTREGSVWIWAQNEEGIWEIEEILEYSETDVKTVLWCSNSLITMGYSGEIVVYSRWEDEMCTKWEIEQTLQQKSTVWDGAILEGERLYLGTVSHDGTFTIYAKDSRWTEVFSKKISLYPILSVCMLEITGTRLFGMVIDRQTLVLLTETGEKAFAQKVLENDEEPIDIIYSRATSSIYILSAVFRNGEKKGVIRKGVVKKR